MEDTLITFETAKLAKEKGFNIPCNSYVYIPKDLELLNKNRESITGVKITFEKEHIFTQRNKYHKGRVIDRNKYTTTISVPTQSLLQKWLRKTYKLQVYVDLCEDFKWKCIIRNFADFVDDEHKKILLPFQDDIKALEKGLQEALKIIK